MANYQEVEATEKRTFKLDLTDTDVRGIYEVAASVDLTPEKLLESFIADLTDSISSNGFDAYMLSQQWLEKLHKDYKPSFLSYLISEEGSAEEVLKAYYNRETLRKSIADSEEAVKSGVEKSKDGKIYTWEDYTDGTGQPLYKSREEWEQQERECIRDNRIWMEEAQETLDSHWKYYQSWKSFNNYPDNDRSKTLEDSLKEIVDWDAARMKSIEECVKKTEIREKATEMPVLSR